MGRPRSGGTVSTSVAIWQLLGNLPPKQRAAVVTRYLHDVPDEQAAEALG